MLNRKLKTLAVIAASMTMLSACATIEEAKRAQATADQALSLAQESKAAAQRAQETADGAVAAAQTAQNAATVADGKAEAAGAAAAKADKTFWQHHDLHHRHHRKRQPK